MPLYSDFFTLLILFHSYSNFNKISTLPYYDLHHLSANFTKWSNTPLPTNCLSVFDDLVGLTLKRLIKSFEQKLFT